MSEIETYRAIVEWSRPANEPRPEVGETLNDNFKVVADVRCAPFVDHLQADPIVSRQPKTGV